jgi:hypothetical protein
MDWKKFFAPMRQKMKKEQMWPIVISALGIIPCVYVVFETGSFWPGIILLLIWYAIVYFIYLIYLYNKK